MNIFVLPKKVRLWSRIFRKLLKLEYLRIAKESLVLAVPSDLAKQMALHGSFSASDSDSDNDKVLFPECNLTLFKDYPFVLTHKNSTIRELVDHIFTHAGFKPDVLFETSNNHAIVSAVHFLRPEVKSFPIMPALRM